MNIRVISTLVKMLKAITNETDTAEEESAVEQKIMMNDMIYHHIVLVYISIIMMNVQDLDSK